MAVIHLIVRYTFFVAIVLSAGFAIERLAVIKRWWKSDSYSAVDLVYNVSSPMSSVRFDTILSKRYTKCLTDPSKPFCLLSFDKRLEIFRVADAESPDVEEMENRLHNITSDFLPRRRRMHFLLITFTRFMAANNVRVFLIEPSMLFCLLSLTKKFDVLSNGFSPGRMQGSRNVVTVGVLSEDSPKLEMSNFTNEMLSAGFKIVKLRKLIGEEPQKSFQTVHCFFVLQDVAVHVVIFYPRNAYLWHAGMDPKELDLEGLLYVNEGLFENFTLWPLDLAGTSISRMFLPYDILYFLKEIESSKTVECSTFSSEMLMKHPNLTREQLEIRAAIAIKEFKRILVPYMAFFWLWSKTLLGWFTECDIFHYSATMDIALMYKSVQGLNFSKLLDDNEFLKVADNNVSGNRFEYKLDCRGLTVNLYIIHEDQGQFWYRHGEGQDKYKYPVFTLCSSRILGQKIHVPCDTDVVLKYEYTQSKNNRDSLLFTIFNKANISSTDKIES